ncbi:gamma-glutamyltransferase [Alteromonas sediminis]|uniref:Glutathione hydrolase proenzyme n=2 Tax=Alteromonas sediminis TaxID=2259342 RepID=A0A3N5Y3G9_9ALTE|nr:gamma-glutamyltransferase [Alteromonas sediminis]
MVVAANPYASWTGKNIIQQGGNAIDAAVAVQAMLTLVEPQSSGIGGGAFILYWDNKTKTLHTIDAREMAPSQVNPYWFMDGNDPMKWIDAVIGGKSVGVPGVLAGLEHAHKKFGKLDWSVLFEDTIDTSLKGFTVSERLHRLLSMELNKGILEFPASASYFYPAGMPLAEGSKRRNPRLAKTLQGVAEQGTDYFYKGEIAKQIAQAVQNASINPGNLTVEDMANYNVIEREPICGTYRGYRLCGMAPPSSGGINVLQILSMLETFPINQYTYNSVEFAHLYSQATAKAYADRNAFIADSDFTRVPSAALVNDAYLSRRAEGIGLDKRWRKMRPGEPHIQAQWREGMSLELPNTSHISIVDKEGNAVSMTTSIEFMFGSGLMVGGFLLNNQLTDFSFSPSRGNRPVLNRVEPGKRPRSAMSPTMVFDDKGDLSIVVGSPGGSRIISYVAQTLIGMIDWDLNIQQAINMPKLTNRNDYTTLEKGTVMESLQAPLEAKGHKIRIGDLNSGLHGIQIINGTLVGGADPRREGIAVGQ